jgi:hypothetical protein
LEAVDGLQLEVDILKVKAEVPSLRMYIEKLFAVPGSEVPQLIAVVLFVKLASQYTPMSTLSFRVPTFEIVLLIWIADIT